MDLQRVNGVSFRDTLESHTCETKSEKEEALPFKSPLSKSCLVKKKIDFCTQNLGSETGLFVVRENDEILLSTSSYSEKNMGFVREKSVARRICRLRHGDRSHFPPPLTTISGKQGFLLRSYRNHGSLVMKLFMGSTPIVCFEAERTEGRLRLRFLASVHDKNPISNEHEEQDQKDKSGKNPKETASTSLDKNLEEKHIQKSRIGFGTVLDKEENKMSILGKRGVEECQVYCKYKEDGQMQRSLKQLCVSTS